MGANSTQMDDMAKPPLALTRTTSSLEEPHVGVEAGEPRLSGFQELPVELKIKILRYNFVMSQPITGKTYPIYSLATWIKSLALVNKTMRQLAMEIFYGENRFIVSRCSVGVGLNDGKFFPAPRAEMCHWICKLEVHFHLNTQIWRKFSGELLIPDSPRDMTYRTDSNRMWMALIRPINANDVYFYWYKSKNDHLVLSPFTETELIQSQWQKHLTSLKKLKIVLSYTHDYWPDRQEFHNVEQLSNYATIDLTADKVEVVVSGVGDYPRDISAPRGPIADVLKTQVEKMARSRRVE